MALKDVVQWWTWWWCQADGWTWWSYRSFPTLTILWFNASDVGRREKERIFWQESQSVFFTVFGWKRRGLPSAPGFFVVFWSTQKYLLPAVWDHRLFSQDYKGWIEVGWSFPTIFLTCLWSGVKACTARSWDKQDFLTVWRKVSPASMVLREEWGNKGSLHHPEMGWKGNVARGEITLLAWEKMGFSISYSEKRLVVSQKL